MGVLHDLDNELPVLAEEASFAYFYQHPRFILGQYTSKKERKRKKQLALYLKVKKTIVKLF
jgi:hypothetical protein